MRYSLLKTFDKIYILDLHGNARKKEIAPDGEKDENVFAIMQGVSINIFIKLPKRHLACGYFCGSASNATLGRISNTSHSPISHNPQNSSTILECQNSKILRRKNTRIVDSQKSKTNQVANSSGGILDEISGLCEVSEEIEVEPSLTKRDEALPEISLKDNALRMLSLYTAFSGISSQ